MTEAPSMRLEQRHVAALVKAERLIFHCDFCPYLELKALVHNPDSDDRDRFRSLFESFYGFNVGGLTEDFKVSFFNILHSGNVIVGGRADAHGILMQLYEIKRKKGDNAMPFSFVSKLMAMHSEESPIYDRHVLAFFGERAPGAAMEKQARIDWYVRFLAKVARSYEAWAGDPAIAGALERLKSRDSRLGTCHVIRLMDFLVWKAGREKLLAV